MTNVKTGDVIIVNLSNAIGHQQGGVRPAVVVSNNIGNSLSPTIEILPGTTKRCNSKIPTHAHFEANEIQGLTKATTFEAESKWTINKYQIKQYVSHLNDEQLEKIAEAMIYATPIVVKAFQKGKHLTKKFDKISNST